MRFRLTLFCFVFFLTGSFVFANTLPGKKEIDSINNLPFDYKIANTSKTIKLTLENVEKARKIKYLKGVADGYFSLGLMYYYQGKYDKNTLYMLKAIRIYEQQNDIASLVKVYGDYGYQLKRRSMPQAVAYMNRAIRLGEEQKMKGELRAVYDNYGVLKEMQMDLDSALYFYDKALKFKEADKDELGIPYSLNKIAMVKIMQKKFAEAKQLFDSAYAIRVKMDDKIGMAENLNFYGHYYKAIGNTVEAIANFTKALELSKKHDYKNLTVENYQVLSELYEGNKEYEKALIHYKNHVRYKDSIQNLELRTKQAELDIEYESEKKEKKILLQKTSLAQKNLWLLGAVALLIISVLMGYLFFNRQKMKNKQMLRENELKEALQLIETQNQLQEQRLLISRDLHDNIGAQLTFIISSLDNLKYGFTIEDEKLNSRLSGISTFTRNTIMELRDTIWAMNKDEIAFSDLKTRIANFIESAKTASHGIQFDFEIDAGIPDAVTFSSLKGINLYRVIQEAINNSIKYAEATHITVKIEKEGAGFIIRISDNGKGFDSKTPTFGNGINNMKKRITEVGGMLSIHTEINNGTEIKIQFPEK
ncbi:Sensor histidine protein kinase UhpB [Flavobacterium cauense R2A-7]|uniref:histidine kinase n=1 Tax=Flavobacterium cauense R2A-7 TaxID=1341154 RepID=V6RYD4_9FLAO|nr:sensor histidine kinase [Flavobacterium cauense]ESU19501.1 Sensor histidine protein kinase UhpB [Flavobacterium cauense R2A-7]TWI14624.1 histidine kinase [Flavobacterium cauense R2A-7]